MSRKHKYYVIWKGQKIGIFSSWEECSGYVIGYPGAKYKSFYSREAAEEALDIGYEDYQSKNLLISNEPQLPVGYPIIPSYCVDASCIGNPGRLEYRCVRTETGEEIFSEGPFQQGTNNIGEFLAIAQALALFKRRGIILPVYTDSKYALGWIHVKKCKTKLGRNELNDGLFNLIDRAELWLRNNTYKNQVLKWETKAWGEIPADYGRK